MSQETSPAAALYADGLSARRGGRVIFEGLSIALTAGQSLMVTGPNGSGKSTLLRILAGLMRSDAGNISPQPGDGLQLCYAGHRDGLKGALTVQENLSFWAALYGHGEDAVDHAVHRLALDTVQDMPAGMLSAGWRRRAGLARFVLGAAPLWILDEPYTALDAENVARIDEVLSEHVTGGGLAVLATHQAPGFDPTHRINMADYPARTPEGVEAQW